MKDYKALALEEYNSGETTAHHGGKDGRPFWNGNSPQFTFVPAFNFSKSMRARAYKFTAKCENGEVYSFVDSKPTALLTPIWKDIKPGVVALTVDALDDDGTVLFPVGLRTFYKCLPFQGRDAYPPKKRDYKECAKMALKFVYEQPFVKYWLENGAPDPTYIYNVYPSKTHSSVINALTYYAKIEPTAYENAIKTAKILADYLLEITYKDGAVKGLPPTYNKDCYIEQNNGIKHTAEKYDGQIMLLYPASVLKAYLNLYELVKEQKYLDAAIEIANYYANTITSEGSWPLVISAVDGKPIAKNLCLPHGIADSIRKLYKVTNNPTYLEVYNKAFKYIETTRLKDYNWEGQFEDTPLTHNYENLSHFAPDAYVNYIAEKEIYTSEDIETATDLIRFIEDQFVVWGKHNPLSLYDSSEYLYPACLEQYYWHLPIDGSAAAIIPAFISAYKITKNDLYLEKAYTLADMITRVQNEESGAIPTYWMHANCSSDLRDFWINCHTGTALCMFDLASFIETL
ncbi:MAG: hypothetical protein IKV61_01305 [Clostridia bacterium]|nr:hypothetical protein [Clostridia bacterium]